MEITLDEERLQAATSEAMSRAVTEAVNGFGIQRIIQDAAGNALVEASLREAITEALAKIDYQQLAKATAAEITRTVVSATHFAITEAIAAVVFNIRHGHRYMPDAEKRLMMDEIRARLEAKRS